MKGDNIIVEDVRKWSHCSEVYDPAQSLTYPPEKHPSTQKSQTIIARDRR